MFCFCLFCKKYSSNTYNTVYSRIILPPRITLKKQTKYKEKKRNLSIRTHPRVTEAFTIWGPKFHRKQSAISSHTAMFPFRVFPKRGHKETEKTSKWPRSSAWLLLVGKESSVAFDSLTKLVKHTWEEASSHKRETEEVNGSWTSSPLKRSTKFWSYRDMKLSKDCIAKCSIWKF